MIPEEEATGKTKDVYDEIKTELGIDFVPNLSLMGSVSDSVVRHAHCPVMVVRTPT
jgi:hypothetical protein